ncbi:cupin domain-containing protein [Breoghania sp. L-A4]|uniref:cupin domain-containing protein n=1 Tax=Breoghania sp. L-A4 TaxID=2304600 RepID=UPI000E35B03B|nr:cupin domain-containing protein [Breoghania sp. L-A4]AXS40046.1 cupin domain-containing protein [Breoghania sp. L-A4]
MLEIGNLDAEFAKITDYWSPRVIAMANGQFVKLAKVKGDFVLHSHDEEDEFFFVVKGTFVLRYPGREDVTLKQGDFHVTPKGVAHHPFAPEETWLLFVEPATTKHTGDVETDITRSVAEQTAHLP